MKAMLTMAHGDRGQLQYMHRFPDPTAGPGEVVVRVAATAVNFHDIFTRRGMPGIRIPLPVIVGSDMAGEVRSIGRGVTEVAVGDRVLVDPLIISGEQAGGMLGETAHGGRAEFLLVRSDQLLPVPPAVSLEWAAALPLAYGTAYRMMVGRGHVQAGDKVLILGASGGVGVACVQLALLAGAEVIACASTPSKLQRLKALGAHHVLDYTAESLVEGVRRIYGKPRTSGGGGVDVAVNFTGGDTWVPTQKCVTFGGRILTCGATAGFNAHTDLRYLWTFEHSMVGSNGWSRSDLKVLLELCASGKLAPIIDKVLPLQDCAEAERLLEERAVFGKILVKP
jgi:alcohol dehydrogenase